MKRWTGRVLVILAAAWIAIAGWHVLKPLPDGVDLAAPLRPAANVEFLADLTWVDPAGNRHVRQEIFDEVFRLVGSARRLIVADFFLYNAFQGEVPERQRALSGQLTRALIARKRQVPGLEVLVISDPINTLYGGLESPHFEALREAGIRVVVTDLDPLRDSNPSWSGLWRLCCRWLGNGTQGGWVPNPVGEGRVTLRSILALLNFKANHRKTLVVDDGDDWAGLVTSANPHDGSSAHGNVALRFQGPAALDLLRSELPVVRWSADSPAPRAPAPGAAAGAGDSNAGIQVLTEAEIRDAALAAIRGAGQGEQLDLAMFYLSHRGLVEALIEAQRRDVRIRVLLDPNKDAFGRRKNGVPNRQVAMELVRAGVPLRWCDTHGEQCHGKMLLVRGADGDAELILGSANYTRRNLDNYNLETNVRLVADATHRAIREAGTFFERRWHNDPQRRFSVPYEAYADESPWRYWQYRFMEFTGWSTF